MIVGRDDVLAEARRALAAAQVGNGGAHLLYGEPGIGKTRLAQEVARDAAADGFKVLWASCWDGGGSPALWPWIQLLRDYATSTEIAELRSVAGASVSDLARIVPGFAGADIPEPAADASPEDRFRLFDTVSSFLVRASSRQPLCVVIDDVQWADPSSVDLLRFLASRLANASILLVATRRSTEPEPGSPSPQLDGLATSAPVLELSGLSRSAVAAMLDDFSPDVVTDAEVDAIHRRSGGNPLFVRELGRLLAQGGTDRPLARELPAAVQSVITRRLERLSRPCRSVLAAASVIGVEFDAGLAERVVDDIDRSGSDAAIEEAVQAGLLMRPDPSSHCHRFAHGIVRDVVYAAIGRLHRAGLHRQVATELESASDSHPDALLEHFERAGDPPDLCKALAFAEAAADNALRRMAFAEAAAIARRGLSIADRLGADDERRMRLELRRGDALNRTGDNAEARPLFLDAARLAREHNSPTTLAEAALGYGYLLQRDGLGGMGLDAELRTLLEEAVAALPAESHFGVILRWRLAAELNYIDPDRVDRLRTEALAGARAIDDPGALGLALEIERVNTYGAATAADRLAIATEIYTLGRTHGLPEIEMRGHVRRMSALIELGDTAAIDCEIAATERLVSQARLRIDAWYPAVWRAMRALLDGRIDDAEKLATDALVVGEDQGQGAIDHYGMHLIAIRREQGRLDEIIDLIRDAAERYPQLHAYRCSLAMACAETGRRALAQAELDALARDDFAVIMRDYNWKVSMMCLSIACERLGDAATAQILLEQWRGLETEFVFVGYGAISGGAVSYYMGIMAATAGQSDEAIGHLEDALRKHRSAGAACWTVRTQTALGRLLAPRDPERAASLLGRARASATELGLISALADLDATDMPHVTSTHPDTGDGRSSDEHVFRRDGDLWTLTFGGQTAHVRDRKGVRDLASLIGSPRQEIHALQLYSGGISPVAVVTDDVIDARAARQYRDRITDLQDEIDDAEAMCDPVRAERARIELDALTETLAAAYGLGGRPRTSSGDPSERARKAVTARVRDGIRLIAGVHRELGDHLDRSVRTGTFLSYSPDNDVHWTL